MTPELHQTTLPNGIRVITQPTPGLQGAGIAIHVASGARDEDSAMSGAAHFIEHLMFKGTEKRTFQQITAEFDALGVDPNAGTSQDGVTYHITVLREYIPKAFEILCDMFLNSTFPERELESERMVILEEITKYNDDHGRFLANRFCGGFWDGYPLGRPVIGYQDTVRSMSRDDLMSYKRRQYVPAQIIVTAAGNVDHDEFVALCGEHLGGFTAAGTEPPLVSPVSGISGMNAARHSKREMEQVQFFLGYRALLASDSRYWAFRIMNNVLGVGMGSRLFREVRELRGLAYSVGSTVWGFNDSAALLVTAGCDAGHAQEAIDVCHQEVMRLAGESFSSELLADAKRQARGRLLLGLDDPCSIAVGMAYEAAQLGAPPSVGEDLAEIDAVTTDTILEIAGELFGSGLPRLESIGPDVPLTLPS